MRKEYLNIFNDYLTHIKVSYAEGTFRFYESHLLHFGRFCYEYGVTSVKDIDRDIIVNYLVLLRRTVSNATINKRVGIIKRLLRYHNVADSYIYEIPKFVERDNRYDPIPDNHLKRIIDYIGSLDYDIGNNLLYAGIIFLLINTGVRSTELYNIEKRNVDIDELEILLTKTKTGKDRIVYFRPVIVPVIKELMEQETNHGYLLHNRLKDRPVNYDDVTYLFKKLKDKLYIKTLHPHMFRHTYATKLIRAGVDVKTVMDFMGHRNLSTTQRYQHADKSHARKSYLEKYTY